MKCAGCGKKLSYNMWQMVVTVMVWDSGMVGDYVIKRYCYDCWHFGQAGETLKKLGLEVK